MQTSKFSFQKWHGLGNDFVVVQASCLEGNDLSLLAQRTCERRFGVGADGLVLWRSEPEQNAIKMTIVNSDGSEAQTCGNAIRCLAAMWHHKTGEKSFSVEVPARSCEVVIQECSSLSESWTVKACMGRGVMDEARSQRAKARVKELFGSKLGEEIFFEGVVDMGNPHLVLHTSQDLLETGEWERWGRDLSEGLDLNVEFFCPGKTKGCYRVFVYERGAGVTLACGSGACAVAQTIFDKGLESLAVTIELMGGSLVLSQEGVEGELWMQGEAQKVYEGEFGC